MGKKFNLKSGNCPSFKEMGSSNSPFNQGFKDFFKKAANTSLQVANPLAFAAFGGNRETFFNSKKMQELMEEFQREKDAKGLKEAEEIKQMTSTIGQASEIPGGHGSRSTRKFKRTNEDLPEQA